MTPDIITTFIINLLQANIKDVFTYTDYAWGNITARFGSTIFYQNENFDADADIVIVPDTAYTDNKSIDLPLDSNDRIKSGSYDITYTVKKEGSLKVYPAGSAFSGMDAPAGATFNGATINPGISGLAALISGWITTYGSVQVKFYDGDDVYIGTARDVTGISDTLIGFDEVTIADYANISQIQFYVPQTYEKTFTYEFCDETPVSDLCVTSNCYSSQLSVVDNTVYPATQTVNSRLLTIQYPREANGTPVATTVTSATASKTIGPNIWSGNYTVTNEVEIEYTGTDDLVVQNTITTQVELNVTCDASLCSIASCINSLRSAYESAARSGSRRVAELQQINFQVLLYVQSYKIAVECGNTTTADSIINSLQEYLGANASTVSTSCNCGYSDNASNNGVPAIIYPLYTVAGGTGEYVPITRTVNGLALSSNIVLTKTNIGLGNVPNTDATNPVNIVQTSSYRFVTDSEKSTWNAKAGTASPTFTGTVTTPAIIVSSETASRVAIIDGSKNVKSADTATYPSLTELSYVKGVTSAIQTQLNSKQASLGFTPQKQTEVANPTTTYAESATTYVTKVLYAEDSGGGYTITLNTDSAPRTVYITKTNKSSNTIQVVVTGSTINGKSTVNLCNQYETVRLEFSGTGALDISAVKVIPIQKQTYTSNGSINVPRGYYIASIVLEETAGNAVTGGLNIATAPAGNDIVSAKALSANQTTYVTDAEMLKRIFSISTSQTIYVEAASAWNSASVNLWVEFKEMN